MRNKGFFWSITIALVVASIYQLSFTWAASGVEKDAEEYAKVKLDSVLKANTEFVYVGADTFDLAVASRQGDLEAVYEEQYLKSQMNVPVHIFGSTYSQCKENGINLGLDLKGGMSATLEISVPDLVAALAGNPNNPKFKIPFDIANDRTNKGEGVFVDLFVEEYEKANEGVAMAKLFHINNPDKIALNASNEDVAEFLKEQAVNALDGVEIIIEKRVNQFGVAQPTIQKQPSTNRIFVELPGVKDKESVRRKLQATANLEFYEIFDNAQNDISRYLAYSQDALGLALYGDELLKINGSTDLLENISDTTKTDTTGTDVFDSIIGLDGEDKDTSEIDELVTNSNLSNIRVPDTLLTPAQKEMRYPIQSLMQLALQGDEQGVIIGSQSGSVVGVALVSDTATLNARLKHPVIQANLPAELVFMWDAKEREDENRIPTGTISLHAINVPSSGPQVSGKDIKYASMDDTQIGKFAVRMVMNDIGADKWNEMTTMNVNKQVAITMDDYVFSAPVVNEPMNYSSSITGNFTLAEATDLAGLLNAGALPAPVKIVDESIVGASLGEDNITSGMRSFIFALLIVLAYMVFYYAKAGLIADIALVINIFLLLGALASLKAILTLPGIAGIVLTIGMAVDANVLIFERIREEIRNGKGLKGSIKDGYAKALSAILDANITTLLTGIVLAIFGTGPIKGFATTLIIGIFTSFFAAVIITRLIITSLVDKNKKVTFSTSVTKNWFTKVNIQFVKSRKKFYILSGVIILLGIVSLFSRGLDYGVDFNGGRQFTVEFEENKADNEAIKSILKEKFEGNEPGVKMVNNEYTALITTKYKSLDTRPGVNSEVDSLLELGLDTFGKHNIIDSKMIAATISKDLKTNSFYAIGFSLLVIFLYILFRFRKWQYGLGALIAMAHDVVIVLSIFSICYGWIGFSMEIDLAFIAAILTVVGYSINDTVVVFDRIREYIGLHPNRDRKEVINNALNSTLGRTVNTSVSTFIVLLVIFLFGGEGIKGFVFALMIGVVVGTYSSLFIATPAVIDFSKDENETKK